MDLSEFLLLRIAEDEQCAREGAGGHRSTETTIAGWYPPLRVLAECEAKRTITEYSDIYRATGSLDTPIGKALMRVAAILAMPYEDHPDYRQEWKL